MTFVKSVSRAVSGPLPTGIQGSGEPPVPAIPVISLTSISGDTLVSSVLSSTVVFSQGYPAPTVTYQWQRNAVNISGATSDTYTLVAADAGAAITLDVQATNSEGSDTDTSNTINASALAVPVISGVPTISGTADVGEVLTATAASVTGNPPPSTTWQWERDGTPIGGETSSTYTVVLADENTAITVVQTETNTQGSDTAESAATTITAAPSISGVPTLSGTEAVGETLTATAASVTGTPTPTRSFQWQRSSDGSTGWADISGATSSTYELVSADEDKYVRAVQTETNTEGTDTANSAASGQIAATSGVVASGGTETTHGIYKVHTFTSNGTFTVTTGGNVSLLLVAGAAGGGRSGAAGAGGAGAGGEVIEVASLAVTPQAYSIVVGTGGLGSTTAEQTGADGNDSTALGQTALGGGKGGGNPSTTNPGSGGSGGGAGASASGGESGAAAAGSGNAGGDSVAAGGGGGGGQGSAGGNGSTNVGGNGGDGVTNDYQTGNNQTYGAGGGGGGNGTGGTGGSSIGGNGSDGTAAATAGAANTGSGGGGGALSINAADGADGIVVIRYVA